MRLRLIQTIHRRQSISTDHSRIDYEESEDESIPSSPSTTDNHRLSSSTGIYSKSIKESHHHLRKSTPSLFHSTTNLKPQCIDSLTKHSSSSQSSSINEK
jgi:hypothetical protein